MTTSLETKSRRLIIVGDVQLSRGLMMTVLVKLGYDVATAATAAEALTLLSRRSYALCFVALDLEDGSGLALAETIRKARDIPRALPVVIFGDAWDREAVIRECERLSLQGYLTKPISISRLVATVRQNISQAAEPRLEIEDREALTNHIDLDHLAQLTGGDSQLQAELAELYLATASQYLEKLRDSITNCAEDRDHWRKIMHALKGASANFGARVVAEVARESEGSTPSPEVIASIENLVAEIRSVLHKAPKSDL